MTKAKKLWLLSAAIVVVACGTIAPVKVAQGDQCIGCRRYIHDTRLASELVYSGGLIEKFKGPACMARYLTSHPAAIGTTYVTDYASGKFVKAVDAVFLPVLVDRDTGESEYRAYQRRADADDAARELGATVVDWEFVLAKARS
jgi:hypothetical protein